ncbi:hypothetical protein CHLRE_03g206000v5 [Chlamydomonas reinhardtii]|uniref:RWD domain-containing protein n=1 Tax=Chlamydomonas reinhardtii TaxID=3055 RepID=A0A2K3DZ13_CHLRE|nr:uncharacterized protein CHLRE_03g206000v5 [Chlamydomonas reinhardtii]PNW85773.1 hypothetical protein CHLRE_03g206000v5 [Chlamydomonas reinhardtii]
MSNEEQEEELCALESIYGSEVVHVSREESLVEVCVAHPQGGTQEVVLRASLPSDYPASSPPIAELFGSHLSDDLLGWAARQMETMFTPGEVVLYQFVEWLKEQELLWSVPVGPGGAGGGKGQADASAEEGGEGGGGGTSRRAAAVQEAVREAEVVELLRALRVTSGEPHVEKKSTFQAHVAPVKSFEEVAAVMDALMSISKIRAATHNIMAYRIHNPPTAAATAAGGGGGAGSFVQDYDDDGETAAGGRLLHLLQAADVRNVVVVVSRWFGGVLMGPGRFTAINNTARVLLEQMGLVAAPGGAAGGGGGGKGRGGRH